MPGISECVMTPEFFSSRSNPTARLPTSPDPFHTGERLHRTQEDGLGGKKHSHTPYHPPTIKGGGSLTPAPKPALFLDPPLRSRGPPGRELLVSRAQGEISWRSPSHPPSFCFLHWNSSTTSSWPTKVWTGVFKSKTFHKSRLFSLRSWGTITVTNPLLKGCGKRGKSRHCSRENPLSLELPTLEFSPN